MATVLEPTTTDTDTADVTPAEPLLVRRPRSSTGFWSWFTTIDHKRIGVLYGITSFAFFLIGGFFRLLGKKFVFDHHDINPELYEAKFGRRDFLWKAMCWLERMTFRFADVSIATP